MISGGEDILQVLKIGDNALLKIQEFARGCADPANLIAVSYTHLTLPTIYSV